MNVRFITALNHLEINSNLGRGDKLDDTTFITNDVGTIRSLIDRPSSLIIGSMEARAIHEAKAVVYSDDELPEGVEPEQYLIVKLYLVQAFLTALWALKDNSVNNELGFLLYKVDKVPVVSSNSMTSLFSQASGEYSLTTFSREELRNVRLFFRKVVDIPEKPFIKSPTQLTSQAPRLARTMYYIQSARDQGDLALKAASYCIALECLYATSQIELAHQLSERVACFLGEGLKERLDIYKGIKKAYSIRSKVIHGDVLKDSKINELKEILLFCDDILRNSVLNIIMDEEALRIFESKSDVIDSFMLEKILGASE